MNNKSKGMNFLCLLLTFFFKKNFKKGRTTSQGSRDILKFNIIVQATGYAFKTKTK